MKNKIEDLRNHLFATIEALQDEDKPMEIDRAKAVAEVASVVIESAKVEVKFLENFGVDSEGTGFIPRKERLPAIPPNTNTLASFKANNS